MAYPDDSLQNRLLSGDAGALGLVGQWIAEALTSPRYWRLRAEWRDLHQEVLARVLDSLRRERYRQDGDFRSYVHGICRFTALQRLTSIHQTAEAERSDLADRIRSDEDAESEAISHQLVRRVLDCASDECRDLIRSYFLEQRSYSELAEELGVPVGTVKSRLFRCLECVRESLLSAGPVRKRPVKPHL